MTGLLSPLHVALVIVVVLLVFGGRRLPELGRLTGTAIRSRLLGKPPVTPPPVLPEPAAPSPAAHPVVGVPARPPLLGNAVRAHARRHVLRSVLARVPGPIGWLVRLLVR